MNELKANAKAPSGARVLIADDNSSVRELFRKLLAADGHDVVVVPDGDDALAAARTHKPDVILCDVAMPRMSGLEFCRRLKAEPALSRIPVVLVTALSDMSDRVRGIEAGADEFLSKPVHPHELRARVASLWRMKGLLDEIDAAEAALTAMALTIEARDPDTRGHCERMAAHAVALGRALGLPQIDLDALHRGGYLHDIGKIGIPDAVLLKPGRLTAAELVLMQQHPEIGEGLCASLHTLADVRPIIRSHHERLDGSGYPDGLRGDAVPHLAQIIGIVDVYDALTSRRPFREAMTSEQAVQHLHDEVEKGRFSRQYVEAFFQLVNAKRPILAS